MIQQVDDCAVGNNLNSAQIFLNGSVVLPPECVPGTYSSTGREPCTPAPAGSYVATSGAITPTLCPVGTSSVAGATSCTTLQTLSIVGGNGTPGTPDASTDWSQDPVAWDAGISSVGAWHFTGNPNPVWRAAYLVGGHPWGFVPGTNSWINCGPTNASAECGNAAGTVVAFRVRFTLPAGSVNPNITFWINSDNAGTYYINGTQVTDRLVGGPGKGSSPVAPSAPGIPGVRSAALQSALHAGQNEMFVVVEDWGGLAGFNYRADVSVLASDPIIIVPPTPADTTPPVIMPTVTGTMGLNGWYTSDVSVSWLVTDPDSTVTSTTGCATSSVTSDTTGVTFTCSATSAGGTASQSVTVKRDATQPVVTLSESPAANSSGWHNTPVTVTPQGVDGTSGIASCAAPVAVNVSTTDTEVTINCTDNAGNVGSASVRVRVDLTPPTITAAATTAPNANGWYNGDVTVHFTCTDGTSGVAPGGCPADQVLSTEGAGISSTAETATDFVGNVSAPSNVVTVKIDKTVPTATASAAPAPNANGWNKTDVTVTFTGADGLSGIASCSTPVVLGEGAGQSASGTCADNAGNVSAPASASNINVDKTAPSVVVTGVTSGASYVIGGVPVAGCATTDALSGVATSATATTAGGPAGSVTVTCAGATDKAGNAAAAVTATYTVTYQVCAAQSRDDDEDDDHGGSRSKGHESGSTIPVKIRLCDANGRNVGSSSLKVKAIGLTPPASLADAGKANPGNFFRFDDGKYIFNLQTKGLPAGTYTLDFQAGNDPTVYHYSFTIRPDEPKNGKSDDKGKSEDKGKSDDKGGKKDR